MNQNQINKRYAGGYRLITFFTVVSYIALGLGTVGALLGLVAAGRMSQFASGRELIYLSSLGGFGISLITCMFLQGGASLLRAVTDTAVAAIGGEVR